MKRLGFILATIHQGSSTKMWREVVAAARERELAIVVFPGGRLDFPNDYEHLRNDIYNLANNDNIDGLIAWSSSLTGEVKPEGVRSFLNKFEESFPLVTIGLSTGSSPNIDFDAYFGFMNEILHFVHVHKATKIAYIRGPENHKSAEVRFQAYKDALESSGIPFSADLVSDPHPWSEGKEALEQLIVERGLIPGLDFDSLICTSDLLMMGAEKYLEALKIDVPTTVRLGGFNDSDENKLFVVSPTTVRMPISSMAKVAVSTMDNIFKSGQKECIEISLPSDLVVRRSCGCKDSFGGVDKAKAIIKDKESFVKWFVQSIRNEKAEGPVAAFVDYLFEISVSMKETELNKAEKRFSALLDTFFEKSLSVELVLEAINWFLELLGINEEFALYMRRVFVPLVAERLSRRNSINQYQQSVLSQKLDSFKSELLAIRSFSILPEALNTHLKKMSFRQAYLVLNVDDDYSKLIGGYSENSFFNSTSVFPSQNLLPDSMKDNISNGVFVVEPLYIDNQSLGYLLLDVTDNQDESLIEDIRASLSSAIKGINLLEVANRAKDVAEKAERASSEFYANVSEGLREPLIEMKNIVGDIDTPKAKAMLSHLAKAEHLLDLTLSEKGEMVLEKSLVSLSSFLGEIEKKNNIKIDIPEELPSLFIDRERIAQGLAILIEKARGEDENGVVEVAVQVRPDTFAINISSSSWLPALQKKDTSLSLAERIVLMHSGSFHFKEHSITLFLSWPTLSGEDVSVSSSFGSLVYITSDVERPLPLPLRGLPMVKVVSEESLVQHFELPEDTGQLAWDMREERTSHSVALSLLRKHQRTRNLPFLCFNLDSSPLDFWGALETHTSQKGDGIILVLGDSIPLLSSLSSFGSIELCESEEGLLRMCDNNDVALIVLQDLHPELVFSIRKIASLTTVPILIIKDHFGEKEVDEISQIPHIILCNTSICEAEEFISRLVGIVGGNELMPPLTGALVKKAIVYLNKNATSQISRWQLAEAVNISEDYLTRIFRKNIGISPWDYLNRYRIQIACELLTQTGNTISEVAGKTGFQDQAYFCRVFKKIKGYSPGQVRMRRKG